MKFGFEEFQSHKEKFLPDVRIRDISLSVRNMPSSDTNAHLAPIIHAVH